MVDLVWLIPALPLAGFVLLVLFGRKLGEPFAGWLATLLVGAAFAATVGVFLDLMSRPSDDREIVVDLFTWIQVGRLDVKMGFLVDPLSITMALFVTGIGALIHLYSIGYMHGDPKFSKFFLYLNFFVFSMLMLVLGENLVVTFLGWEGVGTASYLLISFWFTRNSAAVAGKKAFVTNRIGDFGFMLAMFLIFQAVGSLGYLQLDAAAESMATSTATAIGLLLFLGAVGKSAQLPLFVWLPDAMEGPTPVSALIHAATMVTAGVFLMVRINAVLFQAPAASWTIAIVGGLTALFAATIAVTQNDIKKVLAYSTISQLGYMFLAVGSGGYAAGVFHMITHAFFKALLFLGAGSVIHGMHDEQDMRYMGALRKFLPITAITFLFGWLAIAGVPPFAGFWSKDEVLLYAWNKSPVLWVIGIVTALLTAYYMTRQVILVFFGKARWDDARPAAAPVPIPLSVGAAVADDAQLHEAHHEGGITPHESPWTMLVPLIVLAALSVVGGLLNLPFDEDWHFLEHWIETVPFLGESTTIITVATAGQVALALISIVAALGGMVLAWLVYQRHQLKAVEPELFAKGWYVDEAYGWVVANPGTVAFDGASEFDAKVIDGAVNGTAGAVRRVGKGLRPVQSGFVRGYAAAIGLGAVALLAWFLIAGVR